ncbi:aldose epimerase family protein [Anianabacter salinae]|uniref:aldose epimerase family protein n=1 Tax=Anianabacter salinae TaxID=2851023 RepID=UPI00225E185E|nr:aldose epimerase family protein [Anianabacter salinae]MBV0911575.1 galactose mutarotase [Anianabacter salinae]
MTEDFQTLADGRMVQAVTLSNGGLTARVLTYGAMVHDLRHVALDRPLVLSSPRLGDYEGGYLYAGTIVGRFANRIGNARFVLDGETHETDRNFLGRHTLHGGADGPHAQIWDIAEVSDSAVTLTLTLPDGHMGFPGEAQLTARIGLSGDGALEVTLSAQVTKPCPISLAHHGYFNLNGGGDVTGHRLRIAADHYLPVDAEMIPTGQIAPVADTSFDFRSARPIGEAGVDHNFCLSDGKRPMRPVAWLDGDGLRMTIETTEPGLQVYDGAHFAGVPGPDRAPLPARAGLALETQAWPDAMNQPGFPGCILRPGERYESVTRYVFEAAG